jgi:ABC-2 type transport system ATP-binding protein
VSAEAVIATSALTKDYGSGRGLFGLDLEVRRGEVFGFLGPNGAGKTTTMRLLLDLARPSSGSASVLGLDTHRQSLEIRRRIGFLPGDLALYPRLTGRAVLDYLARLRGGVDALVRDSLAERLDAELDRPVRELSTGNRQKLGLIQAFMHEPELLILDEPIAGLDPLVQRSFHTLLGEISAQGRTVFLSSHTLSEVERVTDRLAILRHGRLVVVDSLENLRRVAVQRLEIEFDEPVNLEHFRALPGVSDASVDGRTLTVAFEGSADAVVKAAATYRVSAIRARVARSAGREQGVGVAAAGAGQVERGFDQASRREHVIAREAAGAVGAAGGERVADRAVLQVVAGEQLVELGARAQEPSAEKRAARALGELLDARQRRDVIDHVVEGVVGVHPIDRERGVGHVAAADLLAHALGERREALLSQVEALEVGGGDAGCRLRGGQALELGADQERLAQLGRRQRAHADAAVGNRRHEAQGLEALERLAHRRAADAESLADVLLPEHLTGREHARDDLVLEHAGEVVGLGRRG